MVKPKKKKKEETPRQKRSESRIWVGEWNGEEREERIPDRNAWRIPLWQKEGPSVHLGRRDRVRKLLVMRLKAQMGCRS